MKTPLAVAVCLVLFLPGCKREQTGSRYTEQRYTGTVGQYPVDLTVASSEESRETTETSSPPVRAMGRVVGQVATQIAPSAVGIAANSLMPGTGDIAAGLTAGIAAYFFGKRQQKKQMDKIS